MAISVFPAPSAAGPLPTRFTEFTSSGTFIHPDGYSSPRLVYVVAMGAGGGGGSGGVRGANATGTAAAANGGGGGGSGLVYAGYCYVTANTTVTIGAAGTGGTSVSDGASGFAGNSGNNGGITYFGALSVKGGIGGGGGQTNTQNTYPYSVGGSGSNPGGFAAASPAKTGTVPEIGGDGGSYGEGYYFAPSGSSSRYGALGANGGLRTLIATGTGTDSPIQNVMANNLPWISGGGGSGASVYSNTVNGTANGGAGGVGLYTGGTGGLGRIVVGGTSTADNGATPTGYAAGGGGGGAALSTTTTATSGAGGNGAPGYVMVWY
jgi:hypothetical protein